jgi:basic amino acid/polyamine antiporter, APA family
VTLRRELRLLDAVMMGLGSIVGAGVFVSIGIAAGVAGSGVLLAIVIAAGVATCNALNSAQLAANHPVSGGTYEYGYRWLHPALGFSAGWMFLCAKTASAATAALGFAGYLLNATGGDRGWLVPVGLATVVVVTAIVLAGVRLSSWVNIAIVSVTLTALAAFVVAGFPAVDPGKLRIESRPAALLEACALMFVAYTGYGRIATLGEEVVEPRRTIPRAIVVTLIVSALLYVAVGVVAVGTVGAGELSRITAVQAAPLEAVSREFRLPVSGLVAVGAMTAMLGVLLNLVLGLSRMVLAMGRRGDVPTALSNLSAAIVVVGLSILGLTLIGSVKTTWSFSAFTVLLYYSITNLAALQLSDEERMFSPAWAWVGLSACLALAFSIELQVWMAGGAVLLGGLALRWLMGFSPRPGTNG